MKRVAIVGAALLLVACAASPPPEDATTGAGARCPTSEIAFTQAEGCMNDGSVELCLPAGDADALAAAQAIAPTLTCTQGSRGRAGCDAATELLCILPMGEAECVARHGAMTDAAWATTCALAARPEIRRVVATWLE